VIYSRKSLISPFLSLVSKLKRIGSLSLVKVLKSPNKRGIWKLETDINSKHSFNKKKTRRRLFLMSKLEPRIPQRTLMKLCQELELGMGLEEEREEDMEPSIVHLLLRGSLHKTIGMV
jgi:hypothetical protein